MSTTNISIGEVSSGLTVSSYDTLIVSGGTAVDTIVSSAGNVSVYLADGKVVGTVLSGGSLYASGGTAQNTTIESGGVFSALGNSFVAQDTTVNSGGKVDFRGRELVSTTVNTYGRVDVYGGTVTDMTLNTSGSAYFYNGGTVVNDLIINGTESYQYTQAIASNGVIVNGATVVGNYAYLTASNANVNNVQLDGGVLRMSGSATATDVAINEGGSMSMEGSATATGISVNQGGWFSAGFNWYGYYGDLSAIGATVVENGGAVYVGSGNVSNYIEDETGYGYYVSSTEFFPVTFQSNVFSKLVYSTGRGGTVHSGTSAEDITAISGGLTVFDGGIVRGYTVTPVTYDKPFERWEYYENYNSETDEWDYTSEFVTGVETVTDLGNLTVVAGGTVTGLVAQAMPGDEYSWDSYLNFEIAPNTMISGTIDGEEFDVSDGMMRPGHLKNANLTYTGQVTAYGVTQVNGSATFNEGVITSNMIFSGTSVTFNEGVIAERIHTAPMPYTYTDSQGGWQQQGEPEEILVSTFVGASATVNAGACVRSIEMTDKDYLHMQVAPNTVLTGTSGGVELNMTNGVFTSASLGSTYVEVMGGTTSVDETTAGTAVTIAGGTVSDLIVNPGACVSAAEGATALNLTENGGAVLLGWGNEIPATITYSINSNTFSYDHLVGGDNPITVHKNTVALDNIMFGGELQVFSGGVVSNFYTVGSGMNMNMISLYEGAIVTNIDTVRYSDPGKYHPGQIEFNKNVTANVARLTDYDGITLFVGPDSVLTNGSIDNVPFSIENGVLSGFMGSDESWFGDTIGIYRGAGMIDCRTDQWANVNIWQGGYGYNNTFADGYVYVGETAYDDESEEGGIALLEKSTLGVAGTRDKGTTLYVRENGVVRDITVNSGSGIEVSSGGKLTGKIRKSGNTISVDYGGVIDFDITAPDALTEARVDSLWNVTNDGRYSITIDGTNQAAGTYVLADATYFNDIFFYDDNAVIYFDLMDVSGSTFGYFYMAEENQYHYDEETGDEWYESVVAINYVATSRELQPAFGFSLTEGRRDVGDGGYYTTLLFTVDSTNAAPEWVVAPTVTADVITFTPSDVVLTVSFDENAEIQQYSLDGQQWSFFPTPAALKQYGENLAFPLGVVPDMTDVGATLTVSSNGTYYFRGISADGVVSDVTSYRVSNIDKVAPSTPTDLGAVATEDGVRLSWAEASDDYSGIRKYIVSYREVGAQDFITVETPYKYFDIPAPVQTNVTAGVTVIADDGGTVIVPEGTVVTTVTADPSDYEWSVQAVDYAGNVSEVATFDSGSAIATPVASADITAPTNGSVTVTAVFDELATVKEYSFDGRTWQAYTDGIVFDENGTVYFRAADADGNESAVASFEVANIDRVAPEAPAAYASTNEITNQDVLVTATFSNDSVVRECSTDGENWTEYSENGMFLSENGKVFFRGADAAGNISEVTEYEVTNIDKIPPTAPVASMAAADTFEGVIVSAVFSDDSVTKEYSLDGRTWQVYQDAVPVSELGMVVYFRGTDAAGNVSEVTEYEVKSLVPGPAAPTMEADVTTPTNGVVTVTATFGEDCVIREYSFDGQTWESTNGLVRFTENGIVYFRGTNADGYTSPVVSYEVNNIDKVAPEAPIVSADITTPTNVAVTVTATFSNDSAFRQYSLDGENWMDYIDPIVLTENGTVYFQSFDAASNVSEVVSYEVTNIDKVAPVAPTVTANITKPTASSVILSAAFSDDSVVREYSLNGENWRAYDNQVSVSQNGTVYFRGTDAAGNVSEVASYEVSNIDREPPMLPTVEQDIIDMTNQPVTVTAYFSDDTAEKWVKVNSGEWTAYTDPIVFRENGTISFRAVDAAGNYTEEVVHQVTNIDMIAPEAPRAAASITEDTTDPVFVSATFDDADAVEWQYSLDGENWQAYTEPVKFEKNGVAYFRALDAVGNISEVTRYVVDNIYEPVVQDSYADDGWNDWAINNVTGALNEELNSVFVSPYVEYKDEILLDKAHSIDVDDWQNFVGKDEVGNVDTRDFVRLLIDENMRLSFTVTASDKASCNLVALTQSVDKYGRTVLSIRSLLFKSLKKDKETGLYTYTGDLQLEADSYDGSKYFLAVDPSSKKKSVFYNVELERGLTEFYRYGNNDDDGGPEQGDYNVVDIGKDLRVDGWVGFGDEIDFYGFSLEHAAKLNFGVTAGTYLAFDLYKHVTKNGKQTLTKIGKTLSLKSELVEMPESGSTGFITLDPGDYYFSVKCTNVQKCGEEETNYIIGLMPGSVFYMDSDDGWNDWVTRPVSRLKSELNTEVTDAEKTFLDDGLADGIQFDREGDVAKDYTYFDPSTGTNESDTYTNYVGFGDTTDFKKVSLGVAANLSFSVHASDASAFTLYKLERNKLGVYALKALLSTNVKYNRLAGEYQTKTKRILLDKGDYYISMQAGKNAETSYYNVNLYSNDDDWDNSTVFFYESEGGNVDDWTDVKTKGASSDLIGDVVELTQDFPWIGSGWVGYGDPIDYAGFTIDGPAKLVFDVSASDKAKFTVYTLQKKKLGYILKPVMEATLKENKLAETSDEKYTAETKALLLTTPGTYYVSMQSTNASKGGNAYYNISVNADKSAFFDNVKMNDSGNDNWKALSATAEKQHVISQKGEVLEGWVGYGDAVDYYGFSLKNNTNVVFSVTATDEAKFTLSAYTERRGKVSLKVVQKKTALKYNDETGLYEFTMSKKMLNKDTLYYITMESTNAKKGGSADYTVAVETFQPSFVDALSMPDASDALAGADDLSLGQFAETSSAIFSAVTDALDDKLGSVMNAGWTTLA